MPKGIYERKSNTLYGSTGKHWLLSEEKNNNKSIRMKGEGNNFYGKKHTEESKKKMSEKLNGRTVWNKGLKNWMSEEGKQRMTESKKGHIPWNKGKPFSIIKGANNVNWKGGVTPLNEKIRKSLEYKIWRRAVFEKDKYTCIWCGRVGKRLHADHIKRFSDYPELRFAIDNGRTLCVECHKKTDTYGRK